ncbi:hypothetical protein FS749_013929 [Ceratobasidium sp. UAMH 11750]|nr:hypothetical protein FS749_013929 [Ceratobasidium sp. UAMH 11750]
MSRRDGPLDRDGGITKAVEAIPGAGFIMAFVHKRNNNPDHAKRALTLSGKGLFAILFGIIAIELGRFDPTMAFAVAAMSFLGTVIADLTIETMGRASIKNKRIAADIPDRGWADTLLDGLVAGAAVGAATGIAPQAEEAAAWALKTVAIVPEEVAIAELEMLSVQNVLYNAPKIGREIIKAATGGVVRASPSGFQMLTARDSQSGCLSPSGPQTSQIRPGKYFIAHAQTRRLLQLGSRGANGQSQLQASKAHFKDTQMWIIEQADDGFTIKSAASDECIGYPAGETAPGMASMGGDRYAAGFRIVGSQQDGFSIYTFDELCNGLDLDLESHGNASANDVPVRFSTHVAQLTQRWLLEEVHDPDVLELYRGPVPTDATLRICDTTTSLPLQLNPPRSRNAFSWIFSKNKPHIWTLEAGFNGYHLKHVPSGLYILAGPQEQDVKVLPLTLGHAETEFILNGNEEDGHSIIYAPNHNYGLELNNDAPGVGPQTLLLWKPDAVHSKWRFESLA